MQIELIARRTVSIAALHKYTVKSHNVSTYEILTFWSVTTPGGERVP